MATPDGANVLGQPEVAAAWYPVNDHPIDKASYSFDVTVPDGYEVVANRFLRDRYQRGGSDDLGKSRRLDERQPALPTPIALTRCPGEVNSRRVSMRRSTRVTARPSRH
jgi:hypothetical protein